MKPSDGFGEDEAPSTGGDFAPVPARAGGSHHLRLFTQREFGIYFAGGALSNVGTWLQNIAAGLLVYDLTGSTLLVGVVNFALFVGSILLAPWAGAAADRFDRRRLLILTQLGGALIGGTLAVVTWLGLVTPLIVIAASLFLGFMLAFAVPALMSLVPLLVSDEDLDAAVALNSVMFNLARAIGPVLGAVIVERAGYDVAFGLNAGSFFFFVCALLVIRPRRQRHDTEQRTRFSVSLRLVASNPRLTALIVAVIAVSMSTDPVNTLPPELVRDVFGQRDLYVGLLVGSFGAGAMFTALVLTGWLRARRRVLVVAMFVQGAGMIGVGLAPTVQFAIGAMFVSGAGFLAAITRSTARVYAEVPDSQRGRVMAIWSLAFLGIRPLASLVDGFVAELAGVRVAAVVLALPVLLTALWLRRKLPPMRVTELPDRPTPT